MHLIVGLGNPGRIYANNRHNIGFMCLSYLAKSSSIRLDRKSGQSRIGTGEISGKKVVLARLQTFMNSSGDAVSQLVKKLHIDFNDLIVIHDDLDLPLGKVRIRQNGSSGGHKGIESIIACLGSRDFIRIRVGIERPPEDLSSEDKETRVIAHVLSDFTPEERQVIAQVIPRVSEAVTCLLNEGLVSVMNKFN